MTGSQLCLREEVALGIAQQLLALAEEPGPKRWLLDLANLTYVSGPMESTLVRFQKRLAAFGGHLAVRNLCPQVHEVFAVTNLDWLLDLRSTEQGSGPAPGAGRPDLPTGVLIVDDDAATVWALGVALRREGLQCLGGDRWPARRPTVSPGSGRDRRGIARLMDAGH
jgi:anti-sigma B factor antagonist